MPRRGKKDWLMEIFLFPNPVIGALLFWVFAFLLALAGVIEILEGTWLAGLWMLYAAIGFIPVLKLNPFLRLSMWASYFLLAVLVNQNS